MSVYLAVLNKLPRERTVCEGRPTRRPTKLVVHHRVLPISLPGPPAAAGWLAGWHGGLGKNRKVFRRHRKQEASNNSNEFQIKSLQNIYKVCAEALHKTAQEPSASQDFVKAKAKAEAEAVRL